MKNFISAGDPHDRRQAYIFKENGRKFVFKPRPTSTERAWSEFLNALSAMGMSDAPSAVLPLREDENGAVFDFVEAPRMIADEHGFYRRFGTLCALCTIMGSTDLHNENVLADDFSPFICDLETLLPTFDPVKEQPPMYNTVLSTALVCRRRAMRCENGEVMTDISAISAFPADFHPYINDICGSFDAAYRFILEHKSDILPLLRIFSGCRVRHLLRPTDIYYKIAAAAKNKAEPRAFIRECLSRAYKHLPDSLLPALDYEIASLCDGNIPLFYCGADELSLCANGEALIENYFTKSPLDGMQDSFSAVSITSLRDENIILRAALSFGEQLQCENMRDFLSFSTENTLSDGQTLKIYSDAKCQTLIKSGAGIYGGIAGQLVCFAAMYNVTRDDGIKARLYEIFERLRLSTDIHGGFCDGAGGIIAALKYAYNIVGDESFMLTAAELFNRADFDLQSPDFYFGAAGAMLSLPLLNGFAEPASIIAAARKLVEALDASNIEMTGFGHGMAGCCAAFAVYSFLSGENRDDRIYSLIKAENEYYNAELFNWRDTRGEIYIDGICSGAPGIALSRLITAKYTKSGAIRELCAADIIRARLYCGVYVKKSEAAVGGLCCGSPPVAELCRLLDLELPRREPPFVGETPGLFGGIGGQLYASLLKRGAPPLFGVFLE